MTGRPRRRTRTPEEIRTGQTRGMGSTRTNSSGRTPKKNGKSKPAEWSRKSPSPKRQESFKPAPAAVRPGHRVISTRKRSVLFSLEAPEGQTVLLAGSFNDWTPQAMDKGTDGFWRITVQLGSGTHDYRFLADGEWREDPGNPRKALNELGGYNSVLQVM